VWDTEVHISSAMRVGGCERDPRVCARISVDRPVVKRSIGW
jgi:hypothetical protein